MQFTLKKCDKDKKNVTRTKNVTIFRYRYQIQYFYTIPSVSSRNCRFFNFSVEITRNCIRTMVYLLYVSWMPFCYTRHLCIWSTLVGWVLCWERATIVILLFICAVWCFVLYFISRLAFGLGFQIYLYHLILWGCYFYMYLSYT